MLSLSNCRTALGGGARSAVEGENSVFALTIAGGRGERLKPVTDTLPKAMVPINGRPLLSYQIEWMRANGVTDVVFLCGYLGEKIEEFVGDGEKLGIRAHYSIEQSPLGRGGAVRKGLSTVPDDEELVLVVNGDIVTDQPVADLVSLHRDKNAIATMTVVPYPSQYGIVEVADDGLVTSFVEKGKLPSWINAGVYIFDRSIESLLPHQGDHETTTFVALASQRKLAALKSTAFWMSVESPKDVREVGERLSKSASAARPVRRLGRS